MKTLIQLLDISVSNPLYAIVIGFLGIMFFLRGREFLRRGRGGRMTRQGASGALIGCGMVVFSVIGIFLWLVTSLGIWQSPSSKTLQIILTSDQAETESSNTLRFSIDNFSFPESIEGSELFSSNKVFKPKNGVFLVINGTVTNFTNQKACLTGQDFVIHHDNNQYVMSRNVLRIANRSSQRDSSYPNFYWGQCFEEREEAKTYLIFDVPPEGEIILQIAQQQVILGEMSDLRQ